MKSKNNSIWDGSVTKILTPLSGEFFPKEGYDWNDGPDNYGELLDGRELVRYMKSIQEAVAHKNSLGGKGGDPCNLMDYFYGSASIKEKVKSAVVSVECAEGVLYGCTTLRLEENLGAGELHELCEYITGQYSDGWGEEFEQRDIQVEEGTLHVHFWQRSGMRFQIREDVKPDPEHDKTRDSGKEPPPDIEEGRPSQSAGKARPSLQLIGHDGNIFSIVSDAGRLLARNGQKREADEMYDRVFKAGSYHEALGIISEYVETELSSAGEKKHQRKQKSENTPCR